MKQLRILLTLIGPSTYNHLGELLLPANAAQIPWAEFVYLVHIHFEPTRAEIEERFNFKRRQQEAEESTVDYNAVLWKLAIHCHFGNCLQEKLWDRMVSSIWNEALQRQLLTQADAKTLEICRASKLAEKNAITLHQISQVHTIPQHTSLQWSQVEDCYHCGGKQRASVSHLKILFVISVRNPDTLLRHALPKPSIHR